MRPLHLTVIVAMVCAACSGSGESTPKESSQRAPAPAPPAAPPNEVPDRDKDPCSGLFDAPPGATRLCEESVMGQGAEIHWSSWAVTSSRWDTFTLYQQRGQGCEGVSSVSKPPLLAVSKGDTRVDIHDVSETGFPTCATKPGPDAKTVVVISGKLSR